LSLLQSEKRHFVQLGPFHFQRAHVGDLARGSGQTPWAAAEGARRLHGRPPRKLHEEGQAPLREPPVDRAQVHVLQVAKADWEAWRGLRHPSNHDSGWVLRQSFFLFQLHRQFEPILDLLLSDHHGLRVIELLPAAEEPCVLAFTLRRVQFGLRLSGRLLRGEARVPAFEGLAALRARLFVGHISAR